MAMRGSERSAGHEALGGSLAAKAPGIWAEVLEKLRTSVSDYAFDQWFGQIREVAWSESDGLTLGVPNLFVRDWIMTHYGESLRKGLLAVVGHNIPFEFVVDPEIKPSTAPTTPSDAPVVARNEVQVEKITVEAIPRTKLNEKYSFRSFIVGPSNNVAAAAAQAVAENPGKVYNPFFIYGGSGLGKTHLLHAVGNHILEKNPRARVVPTSAEAFLNEFLTLLRRGRMEEFRRKFREDVDVLMIDDIQFLRREAQETQNELFHTFNELHGAQKAIILTSDMPPHELDNLEERLRTRFASGMTADVKEPPFEVKVAILKRKAELDRITLPDDVAHFIASAFTRNVRELEGALTRLAATAQLTRRPLTREVAEEVLKDQLPRKQAINYDHVIRVVAEHYGLHSDDLKGDKRTKNVAHARAVAMFLCKKLVQNASYPSVAKAFTDKHHTTVLAAVEKIAERRAQDANLARELVALERTVSEGR